jgi:hypothetical protein
MLIVSLPNAVTQGDCKINGQDCDFEIRGTQFRFRRKSEELPWEVRQILHANVGEKLTNYTCS